MHIKDQTNRDIFLEGTPQRIICLVPSLSELLVDLGLRDNLIGITKFCVHPKSLIDEKTVVGGTKTIHLDKIKVLKPDIILCNKEENTQEIVEACAAIAPTHVSDIKNLDDTFKLINQYGRIFSVEEKAARLMEQIQSKASGFRRIIQGRPSKKMAYLIWRKPWMAAGSDTFIDHLLGLNNFKNIFTGKQGRYPEIDLEELRHAEIILLSSEPFPFSEKHIEEIAGCTDAEILLVDGEYFSWYGSRLLGAFDYFEELQAKF